MKSGVRRRATPLRLLPHERPRNKRPQPVTVIVGDASAGLSVCLPVCLLAVRSGQLADSGEPGSATSPSCRQQDRLRMYLWLREFFGSPTLEEWQPKTQNMRIESRTTSILVSYTHLYMVDL